LEILQRQALKSPGNPWVMPFSPELLARIKGQPAPAGNAFVKPRPGANMPIVQDDSSDHPVIDIRHTQVSKRHNEEKEAAREAARNRDVNRKMEIIKGDETVEERIASLKDKGDMASMAERVALKRQRADMPIVHDDSLGAGVGKGQIPLNAGQHLPSRQEAEAKTEESRAEAELRKQHVDMARKRAQLEKGGDGSTDSIDQDVPPELHAATEVLGGTEAVEILGQTKQAVTGAEISDEDVAALEENMDKEAASASSTVEAENAELKTENAELKTGMAAVMARLEKLESAVPQKRGPGRPKGSTSKTKTAKKIERTPVSPE
jgi:hypothetical protein